MRFLLVDVFALFQSGYLRKVLCSYRISINYIRGRFSLSSESYFEPAYSPYKFYFQGGFFYGW